MNIRMNAALLVLLLVPGCAQDLPPIAKDALAKDSGLSSFENYVPTAYPIGSDADRLYRDLRSQGFRVKQESPDAFSAEDLVWYCDGGYVVSWRVDQTQRIATIQAEQHRCAGP